MTSQTSSNVTNRVIVKRSTTVCGHEDFDGAGIDGYVRHFQVYRGMSPNTSNRLEVRIKELEETVEEERDGRLRAEKELDELGFQVNDLNARLDEADGINNMQIEMNRRRELEFLKVKKDLETLAAEREMTEASLRKRHQDAINELTQQLENSNRLRAKSDKEKQQLLIELEAMSSSVEAASKAKAVTDQRLAELEDQTRRIKTQSDDQARQLQDANAFKAKLSQENFELQRHLQELDNSNITLAKMKNSLQQELDDVKTRLEEETRVRNQLAIQVTNLQLDLDNANMRIEEEIEAAENARAQAQRALSDLQQIKVKHEKEMAVLIEQFDETRRKMAARIAELEHDADQARARLTKIEKERNRLQVQINEVLVDLDSVKNQATELSKRLKQADHVNTEMQHRIDELTNEVQSSSTENQRLHADIGRLRAAHDEVVVKLDAANRDNKQLAEANREAQNQLKELRNQIQDLQTVRIQLETDRESLVAEVNDLREALREAQTRLDASNAVVSQVKADAEHRLREKDNELETVRKSGQRAIEELQRTVIEIESKYKAELSRLRKKSDQQLADYEHQLETLSRSNGELARANKALAIRIKEVEVHLEEERRSGEDARQAAAILERKRIALQADLDDARSLLESADRARKSTEIELGDLQQRIAELSVTLTSAVSDRRRLEAELNSARGELDDASRERAEAIDRAGRLQTELNRVVEEVRQAEEMQRTGDLMRQRMEAELRDLAARLEIAETVALREGKRLVARLQSKTLELEAELDNTVRRERDLANENRKLQRLLAEQKTHFEENQRLATQFAEQNQALQQRVRTLKRQLEEAEEVVLLTLNKYRKATQMLQEAERAQSVSLAADSSRLVVPGGGLVGGAHLKNNRSMSVTREVTRVVRV